MQKTIPVLDDLEFIRLISNISTLVNKFNGHKRISIRFDISSTEENKDYELFANSLELKRYGIEEVSSNEDISKPITSDQQSGSGERMDTEPTT